MSIAVLVSLIFSCQIGIWNSIFPLSSDTLSHHMTSQADCCHKDSTNNSLPIDNSSGDIFTLPDNRLSLVVVTALFLLASLITFLSIDRKSFLTGYFKDIRIKYGGFKLFYYFSELFSSGIINPKIH